MYVQAYMNYSHREIKYFFLQLIKDWLLVVIIVVTVAIDIIILLIGTAIPNSQLQGTRIQDKEQFNHVSVSVTFWLQMMFYQ